MGIVKREVEIKWKYNPSAFEIVNRKVLGAIYRRIGGSRLAINRLLEQSNMLQTLMPFILGITPDSKDVNWEKSVRDYWNSLTVSVPEGGKVLNTSLSFDIYDATRKKYIVELQEQLAKSKKTINTTEELEKYVMGNIPNTDIPNIPEEDRYKYARPTNIEDYLLWRYIQNYSHVANKIEDINKSNNIRFFLSTTADKKRLAKIKSDKQRKAIASYNKFVKSATEEDYNNLLVIFNPKEVKDIIIHKSLDDKQSDVMDLMTKSPEKFVEILNNKSIKLNATLNKYIAFDIFKRLVNSSTVVDANDTSIIIGHTDEECIAFLSDMGKNEVKLNEYKARYKKIIR